MAEEIKNADEKAIKVEEAMKTDEKAIDEKAIKEEDDSEYPTRDRIIFSRTAIGNKPKTINMTGYAAGVWDIDYSINRNVTIGAAVLLPVLSTAVIPHISANVFLSKHFAIGAGVFAGIWTYYVKNTDGYFLLFGGGHVAATYVNGPHMLNLSALCAGYGDYNKQRNFIFGHELGVVASLGYRYSINKNWALLLEVHTPFGIDVNASPSKNCSNNSYGEVWAVMYGFRGHGGQVFGDFGFVLPLYAEYIKTTWQYLPLGIPYFAVGFTF